MQQLPCMLLVVSVLSSACAPADAASMPLPGGHLRDWVIIGPFDNTARSGGRGAFDTDLLTALGGEAKARPKPGDAAGACVARAASIKTDVLNFTDYYPDSDYKIAYAFSEISAAASGEQFFFLGSDDGAKVWVNGELVFEVLPPEGRGIALRQDHFSAKLRKGNNSILVKVENLTGGWSLALEKVPEAVLREVVAQQKVERNRREFQHLEIAPGDWPGYVYWFENGGAPRIGWQNPERVRELVGDVPLTVRWFDSSLNEVQQPDKPGRYAAYIEGKLPDGTPVRRALTFYSAPREFEPWIDLRAAVPHLGKPADPEVGKALEAAGYRTLRNIFMDGLIGTQDGAMLVAAAFETKPGQVVTTTESPAVLNDDFQLALKLKLLGLDGKTRPLGPPKDRSSSPAPTLHEGTPAEAGVNPDAKEKIDAVCRAWAAESGEPLSTLVARHGVIITHCLWQGLRRSASDSRLPLGACLDHEGHLGRTLQPFPRPGLHHAG